MSLVFPAMLSNMGELPEMIDDGKFILRFYEKESAHSDLQNIHVCLMFEIWIYNIFSVKKEYWKAGMLEYDDKNFF